jgi:hypothetical protein
MPAPLSSPPPRPTNWWRTIPGQLAILVVAFGVVLILCQVLGVVDVRG